MIRYQQHKENKKLKVLVNLTLMCAGNINQRRAVKENIAHAVMSTGVDR